MYNENITKNPFDGNLSIKRKYNHITDENGQILGGVTKKDICDLNGEKVAEFVTRQTAKDADGKKIKIYHYRSDEAAFRLEDDKLYRNGQYLGAISKRVRNGTHIALLAIVATLLLTTIALIALIDLPFSDTPVIDVRDELGAWTANGTIAVLDDSIHPNTSGEYEFIVSNSHNVKLSYGFTITEFYNGEEVENNFPLLYRVRMNNGLLLSEDWHTADEIVFSDLTFMPESEQIFTLEWWWPFESGDDEADTLLGIENGTYHLEFNLTAEVYGEE